MTITTNDYTVDRGVGLRFAIEDIARRAGWALLALSIIGGVATGENWTERILATVFFVVFSCVATPVVIGIRFLRQPARAFAVRRRVEIDPDPGVLRQIQEDGSSLTFDAGQIEGVRRWKGAIVVRLSRHQYIYIPDDAFPSPEEARRFGVALDEVAARKPVSMP